MYEIISARGKRTAKATVHTFIVVLNVKKRNDSNLRQLLSDRKLIR